MEICHSAPGSRSSFYSMNGLPLTMETQLKAVAGTSGAVAQNGGLIVIGETVATLHKEIQGSKVRSLMG